MPNGSKIERLAFINRVSAWEFTLNLFTKKMTIAALAAAATLAVPFAQAAQLTNDGKAAIPKDVQQVIVVDYRAMQNSPAAMNLKDRVLPPELKRLETALKTSGLKVDQDRRHTCVCGISFRGWNTHCRHSAGTIPHRKRNGELRQEQDQGDRSA